jgi:ribose 1,5-bisphosphate isomerase
VLAFDYSSTMLAILTRLGERGLHKQVVVPESRCLDGGRPIVEEATLAGHHARFVPDMAFGVFVPDAGAVLIGAETFFANGDCWNTIGSYPIAHLARVHGVPFYVATELIKIDRRSYDGPRPPVRPRDFGGLLGAPGGFSHPERVDTVAPELDTTPAELISAYVTPVGVVRPEQVGEEARNLYP